MQLPIFLKGVALFFNMALFSTPDQPPLAAAMLQLPMRLHVRVWTLTVIPMLWLSRIRSCIGYSFNPYWSEMV